MVNVESFRDWPVNARVYLSVQEYSRLVVTAAWLLVPCAPVPLNAGVTHTAPPIGTFESSTKPIPDTKTGCSLVPIIFRPPTTNNRHTSALVLVITDLVTRRGPFLVSTQSPATTCLIGRSVPSAMVTNVSPTRHWGPRKRSGSSAEKIDPLQPVWKVNRRLDGSYSGLCSFGKIESRPLSPSTMTSRASAAVEPIRLM